MTLSDLIANVLGRPSTEHGIENPSIPARIGAGMMDVWSPLKSAYLHAYHPELAAAYDQRRNADNALYLRGLTQGSSRRRRAHSRSMARRGSRYRCRPRRTASAPGESRLQRSRRGSQRRARVASVSKLRQPGAR
jgi:hypothetical protein